MVSAKAHLLVFGATGPSGIVFVEEALKAGHQLTIYARSPTKLPENLRNHANVTIVKGTFENLDAVKEALQSGATALVSFAGPTGDMKGTAVTDFYEKLFPLITENESCSIRRCIVLTTPSFQVAGDKPTWKVRFLVFLIKHLYGDAYSEVNGIGKTVSKQPLEKLEWTLFRVPALTNSEAKPVRARLLGEGGDGIILSRKSIAVWILQELEEKKWVGKAPALSNPGWI